MAWPHGTMYPGWKLATAGLVLWVGGYVGEKAAATGGGRGLGFLLSADFVRTRLRMPQFLSL